MRTGDEYKSQALSHMQRSDGGRISGALRRLRPTCWPGYVIFAVRLRAVSRMSRCILGALAM